MDDLKVGDRLDRYELTDLLARSGMASVFKALDTASGRAVALKVPHLHYESDVVFDERFRREQRIGERLSHPGIVRVFPTQKARRKYLAMELVEGRSLRALIDAEKKLSVPRALELARKLAEVLVYLHANGVVHRDLKPDNIIVNADGEPKLLDFGIALDEASRRITWFGLSPTLGTPDYMAPEQVNGRRGDARTDIYALGTMLFEMLTGQLPFIGGNAQALLRAKGSEEPRSPRELRPELDANVEDIVLHAIERLPSDRYARAADLLADLEDPSRVVPRDRSEILARKSRALSRETRFTLALCAVIALLGSLIWLTHRHRPPAPPPVPATSP